MPALRGKSPNRSIPFRFLPMNGQYPKLRTLSRMSTERIDSESGESTR